MDYKGYKLLDKLILVCKDFPSHDNEESVYQAYFVDPANTKQLAVARQWATWIEWGPSHKSESGRWECEYEIKHEPVEFNLDNNGFVLELLDCAGGSSQGGKLSFWNCLVKKDSNTFKIGINSEMLLDLLKSATFEQGVCQEPLIFISHKGKLGMTTIGSETYKACVSDCEFKKDFKAKAVSKFSFGDILKTATLEEVYLGTITQYYTFDVGENINRYYYSSPINLRACTITKLAQPIKYHVFDYVYDAKALSDLIPRYDGTGYSRPIFRKSCPKRAIDGKLELDYTEEDFYQQLITKFYDYEAYKAYATKWHSRGLTDEAALYQFLNNRNFGYGLPELPEELMEKIKAAGIKYIEE